MGYLNPLVYDSGLSVITAGGNRLDICRSQPVTYVEATTTFTVGNKVGLTITAPQEMSAPAGRKVTVAAILDGSTTYTSTSASDDAEYWAISDTVNGRLLAAGLLATADLVMAGDGFTLTEFDIGIPYPIL